MIVCPADYIVCNAGHILCLATNIVCFGTTPISAHSKYNLRILCSEISGQDILCPKLNILCPKLDIVCLLFAHVSTYYVVQVTHSHTYAIDTLSHTQLPERNEFGT